MKKRTVLRWPRWSHFGATPASQKISTRYKKNIGHKSLGGSNQPRCRSRHIGLNPFVITPQYKRYRIWSSVRSYKKIFHLFRFYSTKHIWNSGIFFYWVRFYWLCKKSKGKQHRVFSCKRSSHRSKAKAGESHLHLWWSITFCWEEIITVFEVTLRQSREKREGNSTRFAHRVIIPAFNLFSHRSKNIIFQFFFSFYKDYVGAFKFTE